MKILIGIATFKRKEKLARLLESLFHSTYKDFDIVIVCDNQDYETAREVEELNNYPFRNTKITVVVQKSQQFVVGAWNRCVQDFFMPSNYNAFIGFVDDITVHPLALETMVKFHEENNPEGVTGFAQECPGNPQYTFKWFGQTLMSRKFIQLYKRGNYRICCPDYNHFYQDEEMHEFAQSLGLFNICPTAVLYHYHPGFCLEEMDETHHLTRSGKNSPQLHDIKMNFERKHNNWIWGRDFNLIGKGTF